MRSSPLLTVAGAIGIAAFSACLPVRRSAQSPAARAAGTYTAKVSVSGRSTYTGSLELAAVGDSLVGRLMLTSPISIDVKLAGVSRNDTLYLAGPYSGANGCTGEFRASLFAPGAQSGSGPFQLADKCVGALSGTMTAVR